MNADDAWQWVFEAALDAAYDAVLITDGQLDPPGPRVVYVNRAFTEMTGYPPEAILGKTPRILQGPGTDRAVLDHLRETLARGETFTGSTVNYRRDGTPFDLEWRTSPVRDDQGRVRYYVSLQRDVTSEKRLIEQLRREADFDSLTAMLSRRAIERQLEAEIRRSRRHALELGLLVLDFDRFKAVNDRLGHTVGDEVLERVGQRIRGRMRRSDKCGRWGGEEFILVLPHTDRSGAQAVARSILEHLRATDLPHNVRLTASIGATELAADDDMTTFVRRADRLMYQAKREGGDRVHAG